MFQSGVQPARTGLPQVLHEELHGGESPLPGLRALSCESSGQRCHGLSDAAGVRDWRWERSQRGEHLFSCGRNTSVPKVLNCFRPTLMQGNLFDDENWFVEKCKALFCCGTVFSFLFCLLVATNCKKVNLRSAEMSLPNPSIIFHLPPFSSSYCLERSRSHLQSFHSKCSLMLKFCSLMCWK